MNQSEINYQNKMRDNDNKRITLLSEKYGHENKIEYRETKENKALGLAIIIIVGTIVNHIKGTTFRYQNRN